MKLAIITSSFPFGGEDFFRAELRALCAKFDGVFLFPLRPLLKQPQQQLAPATMLELSKFGPKTLRLAVAEARRRPAAALHALWMVASAPSDWGTRLRNLLYYPKALAMASCIRRLGIDHLHAYWLSEPATVAYVASMLSGIVWSSTAHRTDIYRGNILPTIAPDRRGGARFIRAVSRRGRDDIAGRISADAAARVHVVHLGVKLPDSAARLRDEDGVFSMICAAFLIPRKGHRYLLEAVRKAVDVGVRCRCDIAGDGPLQAWITNRVVELDLKESVRVRGRVEQETLLVELRSGTYDAAVLATIDDAPGIPGEGIPVFLMEAMAAGLPCIATKAGGVAELIDDASGILVEQLDSDALAAAIVLLARDRGRRAALAAGARSRIASDFDVDVTARQLATLIRNGERGPRRRDTALAG